MFDQGNKKLWQVFASFGKLTSIKIFSRSKNDGVMN